MLRIIICSFFGFAALHVAAKVRTIDEWNAVLITAIRTDSTAPGLAVRNLALMHSAGAQVLEAFQTPHPEADLLPQADADPVLSLASACRKVATILYPGHAALFHERWERQTSGSPAAPLAASLAFGEAVALRTVQERERDGVSQTITYLPSNEPGHWRRTPPAYRPPEMPQWSLVAPYWLESCDQFRPPPPPALDSEAYAIAWERVRKLGGQEKADLSKADLADFWACFSYTATPPGHWNTVLQQLMIDRDWPELKRAKAYALLNCILHDTAIAAWDCKYYYKFWRPIHAIQEADKDNNPLTQPDPGWDSYLPAPPHPEYVSGHSTFAGAGAEVLTYLFGTDAVSFTTFQDDDPSRSRHYASFSECAQSMGLSRIYGGIHFDFSDQEGRKLGRNVARWGLNHEENPFTSP